MENTTPNPVDRYLDTILLPQMVACGVNAVFAGRIRGTVRTQMLSCIAHWNDIQFRKALLLVGSEEGAFYQPLSVDIDVRNFVVITLRNSEFETLQSHEFAAAGLSCELPVPKIVEITSTAIKYFRGVDFSAHATQYDPLPMDLYGDLAKKYQAAWMALSMLANAKTLTQEYTPVASDIKNYDLLVSEKHTLMTRQGISAAFPKIVSDAYALTVDKRLEEQLNYCLQYKAPLVLDSFKGLTRNIEKLLLVMELLLGRGAAFVTSNYYFENGHVEKRAKPLRAMNSTDTVIRNWSQTAGLGKRHRVILEAAARAQAGG